MTAEITKDSPGARRLLSRENVLALLAIALAVAVLSPVLGNEFVYFDDYEYVVENPRVSTGISAANIRWAFTTFHEANWHPLTWLSHMADAGLYGLEPRGHHLTNLLLHGANAGLLFLALFGMTGALWRSALVAALFGVHPLHVESVAWVAERKDVLSAFFWFLGLAAYARYARRPGWGRYLMVLACLALGLMAKPMPVTMPFLLLLLDWWPLGRLSFTGGSSARLALEKVPLLLLAAASAVVTYLAQQGGGALMTLGNYPAATRVANALTAYTGYLGKMLWPAGLSVFYAHPVADLVSWQAAAALAILVGLTGLAWFFRRRGYPATGWLWFLGTLVPVIGLVQVGDQAMADRYTYVPLTGLFIVIVWGIAERRPAGRGGKAVLAAAAAVLLTLAALTVRQAGYWKDTPALLGHSIAVNPADYLAYNNLGVYYQERGRPEEGIKYFLMAVKAKPDYTDAHYNLGLAYRLTGRFKEAREQYRLAVLYGSGSGRRQDSDTKR